MERKVFKNYREKVVKKENLKILAKKITKLEATITKMKNIKIYTIKIKLSLGQFIR